MKLIVIFLLVFLFACTKTHTPQPPIPPAKPNFEIETSENLVYEVYDAQNTHYVDTFLAANDFFIYNLGGAIAYPLELRFKAIQTNSGSRAYPVTGYSWKIGGGPLRTGKEITLNFPQPVGTVDVTLIVEYNQDGNILNETFSKQINVNLSSVFGGNFNGVIMSDGQPVQNTTVQVGVLQTASGKDFYGIRNIVPGLPADMNITPTSRAFAFDYSFFTQQSQFSFNNMVTSLPHGFGYFKGDSLYIDYGYREFPAMGDFEHWQTRKLQFKGKKI